jgi:thiamine-monophosphate kinase
VTGTIGDAALGLALRNGADWTLPQTQRDYLGDRYLLPRPRNALSEAVRMHASAAMDISDGLVGDLGKLCRASHVMADIAVATVPLSEAARAVLTDEAAAIETILTGGDDYEIICTVAPAKVAGFRAAAQAAEVPLTEIGTVAAGEGVCFVDGSGQAMTFKRASFSHF